MQYQKRVNNAKSVQKNTKFKQTTTEECLLLKDDKKLKAIIERSVKQALIELGIEKIAS